MTDLNESVTTNRCANAQHTAKFPLELGGLQDGIPLWRYATHLKQYSDIGASSHMTLIVAMRAITGELIIAADRRTSTSAPQNENENSDDTFDDRIVLSNRTTKLIDFDNAIIGVAGKYATALYVIRDFIANKRRDSTTCYRLSKRLAEFYAEKYGPEWKQWPSVSVTYCDWHNRRGRIVRLLSREGFVPEEPDTMPYYSGHIFIPTLVHELFGVGSETVAHVERYCILALMMTASFDTSVGDRFDLWILDKNKITRRLDDDINAMRDSINAALVGTRARLYP
jgi:hypothetical protein